MLIISFVNVGIVILVVNFDLGWQTKIPIFSGSYVGFSVEWYKVVGTNLCI